MTKRPILIATRGSALALAQANAVLGQCRAHFPTLRFELTIIKTTGDKLQTASLAQEGASLPKGLFTKELEVALLEDKADLAVHSLKDLPTELPKGLKLGAVGTRADVRDVLIYREIGRQPAAAPRGFPAGLRIEDLPPGAVVATSSTRRRAQLLALNPGLTVPDIRGNVATRLQKLAQRGEMDATMLALAGMSRLQFQIAEDGHLAGPSVPSGLLALVLETRVMLPCVGQGAVGIEIRENDERAATICEPLNHYETCQCVTAERTFLAAMGGGCQSPVGAYAAVRDGKIEMQAVSFVSGLLDRAAATRPLAEPVPLGHELAERLKP